jgi:hypothetical protein
MIVNIELQDCEMSLLFAGLPAQAHVAAALPGDAVAVGRQAPGQIRAIEVAGVLHRTSKFLAHMANTNFTLEITGFSGDLSSLQIY